MRDGFNLAADVHRPLRDGEPVAEPLPVLLQRTPYNKSAAVRVQEAEFFTLNGFVTVMQDCRGRYASEGGFTKYVDEGRDGYDTVEWLARQPWCNGKVGTLPVLRRPYPGGSGLFNPAASGCYVAGMRGFCQCLPKRMPQRRRL